MRDVHVSERSTLLPANSIHTRNHPTCFTWCTCSIGPRSAKRAPPDRFYDVNSDDESAIFESAFHLRPPVHERNFLISPPGSPPGDSEQTEEPANEVLLAVDPQRVLEQLRVKREQEDREWEVHLVRLMISSRMKVGSYCETGVCVRVQNWRHRRRVVTRCSEGWDALDEEPSDGEWELHSPIRLEAARGSSLLLRVWLLSYTYLLLI